MARLVKITGMKNIINNIRKFEGATARKLEAGLKRAGLTLQRDSQKIVPVEFGVLKNSATTRNIGGTGFKADILVGYTAEYAVFVHEIITAQHKAGKQAKFLEHPARTNRRKYLEIVGESIYGF